MLTVTPPSDCTEVQWLPSVSPSLRRCVPPYDPELSVMELSPTAGVLDRKTQVRK